MASTVWKGVLSFGLVAIPVRLVRAARPERVKFQQVRATRAMSQPAPEPEIEQEDEAPAPASSARPSVVVERVHYQPVAADSGTPVASEAVLKGFEFEPGRFVTLEPERLSRIAPETSRDMVIGEFVKLESVDPIFFETSYYVLPEKAGEHAYALLVAALRKSGYCAVAEVAMHRREHVVIIRPGASGLILHTMFYVDEVRAGDEAKADLSNIAPKEMKLAEAFIESLAGAFEPEKYRDAYRERVKALIDAELNHASPELPRAKPPAPVVDIIAALQKSLAASKNREKVEKKPMKSSRYLKPKTRRAG